MQIARAWRLLALALATALALGPLGCSDEASDAAKPGHGVIRGLDPARSEVTIEHGEIPDLMMAMTMTFSVDDPTLLAGVVIGDEVDFFAKQDGERYVVTEIRKAPK
jgi:Cu/Ag efflux protein CusF